MAIELTRTTEYYLMKSGSKLDLRTHHVTHSDSLGISTHVLVPSKLKMFAQTMTKGQASMNLNKFEPTWLL